MNILVINGPNLNLLGERKKEIYGIYSLEKINREIKKRFKGISFKFFQSNHEGIIIDLLHKYRRWADWLIINPGAHAHYSYAIRDAIEASGLKALEVHLSDIDKREPFRKKSVIKEVCEKQIKGKGFVSYIEAVKFCLSYEKNNSSTR